MPEPIEDQAAGDYVDLVEPETADSAEWVPEVRTVPAAEWMETRRLVTEWEQEEALAAARQARQREAEDRRFRAMISRVTGKTALPRPAGAGEPASAAPPIPGGPGARRNRADHAQVRRFIAAQAARIPDVQLQVSRLYFVERISVPEVAARLGMGTNGVRWHIARCRRNARRANMPKRGAY